MSGFSSFIFYVILNDHERRNQWWSSTMLFPPSTCCFTEQGSKKARQELNHWVYEASCGKDCTSSWGRKRSLLTAWFWCIHQNLKKQPMDETESQGILFDIVVRGPTARVLERNWKWVSIKNRDESVEPLQSVHCWDTSLKLESKNPYNRDWCSSAVQPRPSKCFLSRTDWLSTPAFFRWTHTASW